MKDYIATLDKSGKLIWLDANGKKYEPSRKIRIRVNLEHRALTQLQKAERKSAAKPDCVKLKAKLTYHFQAYRKVVLNIQQRIKLNGQNKN